MLRDAEQPNEHGTSPHMSHEQKFWAIESQEAEPDMWVCMSCLSEAFKRQVPIPDCPACHGVSTYEAFTMESIQDWGTEELIAKAMAAAPSRPQPSPQPRGGSGAGPAQ